MNKTRVIPRLELLNSESPILMAYKVYAGTADEFFMIVDEWKKQVNNFTHRELLEFVKGERDIVDSNGRIWNYPSQSEGMKREEQVVLDFIGSGEKLEALVEALEGVKYRMEAEGFHYCFKSYSTFEEVEDEHFHELRKAYLEAADALERYVHKRLDHINEKI